MLLEHEVVRVLLRCSGHYSLFLEHEVVRVLLGCSGHYSLLLEHEVVRVLLGCSGHYSLLLEHCKVLCDVVGVLLGSSGKLLVFYMVSVELLGSGVCQGILYSC